MQRPYLLGSPSGELEAGTQRSVGTTIDGSTIPASQSSFLHRGQVCAHNSCAIRPHIPRTPEASRPPIGRHIGRRRNTVVILASWDLCRLSWSLLLREPWSPQLDAFAILSPFWLPQLVASARRFCYVIS